MTDTRLFLKSGCIHAPVELRGAWREEPCRTRGESFVIATHPRLEG